MKPFNKRTPVLLAAFAGLTVWSYGWAVPQAPTASAWHPEIVAVPECTVSGVQTVVVTIHNGESEDMTTGPEPAGEEAANTQLLGITVPANSSVDRTLSFSEPSGLYHYTIYGSWVGHEQNVKAESNAFTITGCTVPTTVTPTTVLVPTTVTTLPPTTLPPTTVPVTTLPVTLPPTTVVTVPPATVPATTLPVTVPPTTVASPTTVVVPTTSAPTVPPKTPRTTPKPVPTTVGPDTPVVSPPAVAVPGTPTFTG